MKFIAKTVFGALMLAGTAVAVAMPASAGWSFGVAITSGVLAYAIWGVLGRIPGLSQMTLLENNCMQSTASAAGYSTGGTLATAVGRCS